MKKLLITMGDPAGIGPEITLKLLHQLEQNSNCEVHIVGEKWILEETASRLGSDQAFTEGEPQSPNSTHVISLGALSRGDFNTGIQSAKTGEASYRYFKTAVDMCLAGDAHGIVTAPISKEAINLAGHAFLGHTEILSHFTNSESVMAIWHPKLVVGHVTDHLPLRKALDSISVKAVIHTAKLTADFLKTLGTANPVVALAGINPHAGENGILGTEEKEILGPAIRELGLQGYNIEGPVSGDSVFNSALRGKYQGVIAMYHDQGFGPMKTLDLNNSVNVTLGLPFVRTSPDHGTAMDIAGRNIADESSMLAAFKLAEKLVVD